MMGRGVTDPVNMDSRLGSQSSRLRSGTGMRRQTSKISPFCSLSSSKLTQSIIRDHMVAHYKKVYSAKAAIDTSAPKSMTLSIKYNDRIRQERLKKGGRPPSSHSASQRTNRSSCSSALSGSSAGYGDGPYVSSGTSTASSPGFGTSFRRTEAARPSCEVSAQRPLHCGRPTSEMKLRSSAVTLNRKQSACSLGALGDQICNKSFQDPARKTYNGDLLEKHSQRFTQDKPFTPKTLKSDGNSYLSSYRYYRAPRRTQDCTPSKDTGQESDRESTKSNKHTAETNEPCQALNTERDSSEEDRATHFQPSRQDKRVKKGTDSHRRDPFHRASAKDGKSPMMKSISAEEEELMYLEFISAVTEDILSREFISDRVLDRVSQRHIDINRHKLNEGKMRHLVEVLCKDFKAPDRTARCFTDLEVNQHSFLDAFNSPLGSEDEQERTKGSSEALSYPSPVNRCDSPDYSSAFSASTPTRSERSASPARTVGQDEEDDGAERSLSSPQLSDRPSSQAQGSVEGVHHSQTDAGEASSGDHELESVASDKELSGDDFERCDKVDDLEAKMHEMQLEARKTGQSSPVNSEEHTASSVSDDDF